MVYVVFHSSYLLCDYHQSRRCDVSFWSWLLQYVHFLMQRLEPRSTSRRSSETLTTRMLEDFFNNGLHRAAIPKNSQLKKNGWWFQRCECRCLWVTIMHSYCLPSFQVPFLHGWLSKACSGNAGLLVQVIASKYMRSWKEGKSKLHRTYLASICALGMMSLVICEVVGCISKKIYVNWLGTDSAACH